MAKGYPDYYGIPMFPSYLGTARSVKGKNITTDGEVTVVSATGKGVLHKAVLISSDADMDGFHVLRLRVDDNEVVYGVTDKISLLTPNAGSFHEWLVLRWDVVAPYFHFIINTHLPFVDNCSITFDRNPLNDVLMSGRLLYSLIAD